MTYAALPFNGLHPRNPCNYMDYYSFTDPAEGWKAELSNFGTRRRRFFASRRIQVKSIALQMQLIATIRATKLDRNDRSSKIMLLIQHSRN